jgi:glycosyltransferase involved in cell wall biosynthesis
MKIAIVNYELLPQTGTSARTLGLVRSLVDRGHRVVVLVANENPSEARLVKGLGGEYFAVCSIACGKGPVRSLVFASILVGALRTLHGQSPLDVIFFSDYSMNVIVYPLIKRSLKLPIVSDLHALTSLRNLEPDDSRPLWRWVIYLVYEALALRFSDVIMTPTDELREVFLKICDKPVLAVRNCVSITPGEAALSKVKTGERDLPKQAGKNTDWVIFFHANFLLDRSVREVARLSEIARRIRARGYKIRVLVAGPGSSRVSLNDGAIVNLGYVENPYDQLLECDLAILPVTDVTMGLHSRLVEAMMAGRPVVASREACCGILSHIQESGIIMCNSLEDMASSACSLFEDPQGMRALGRRNAHLAKELFSSQRIGADLERVCVSSLREKEKRNGARATAPLRVPCFLIAEGKPGRGAESLSSQR